MRVTLVTETYFPQLNGVSRTLGELVRFLTENGDRVQLVCPDYGQGLERPQDCSVRSVVLPFYKELRLPLPPFGHVHRAIAAFRPDLIHIATEATLGLSTLRFARRRRIPVVSSFHTNFDQYSGYYRVSWARDVIWRYLRWFHNSTRETYVPSETTISALESFGIERLVLWKRGVDSTMFRPERPSGKNIRREMGLSRDEVVVGYVGRIAAEKNVNYLAEALDIVARESVGARALWVGDGPARSTLERRTGSYAHFAGYRHGEDLADHYAACDIFAFTSLTETFGNVVLEAMSSGLPVVALRAGGVADNVQSGTTGILVDPSEPPARFAFRLLELINDRQERMRMARAAREYALGQSWDAIMAGLRDRYELVVSECRGQLTESLA